MKKKPWYRLAIAFLCLGLCLSGCAKGPLTIAPEAVKYLEWLHVFDSEITACRTGRLSRFKAEVMPGTWVNLTEDMVTLNEIYYKAEVKEDTKAVEAEDVVTLELFGKSGRSWTSVGKVDIIAGEAGTLWPELQTKIVGKSKNESIGLKVPTDGLFLPEWAGQTVQLKVVEISQYTLKSIGALAMSDTDAQNSFEFYEYLFNKRWDDERDKQIVYRKQQFLELAKASCTFSVADEDIENYGYQIAKEQRLISAGAMMVFERYCSNILGMDMEEFYQESASQALEGIKRILWVGAVAQKLKLSVSEEDLAAFCQEKGIDRKDLQSKQYDTLRYYLLEDKVLTYYLGEQGANVWMKNM